MVWLTSLFPFIPPHMLMLVCGLVVLWVLFRWGDAIFTVAALWMFWQQQYVDAVCYFIIAMFFAWAKAWNMLFDRAAGYRGPWV